jgi:hypothetical protein
MDITIKEKLSGIFPPCMTIFDESEKECTLVGVAKLAAKYIE